MNKTMQKKLIKEAKWILDDIDLNKLRGVTAEWRSDTAHMKFYFNGKISEDDLEELSVLSGEIIARFSEGFLDEQYIRLDCPALLPENEYWVYKRDE